MVVSTREGSATSKDAMLVNSGHLASDIIFSIFIADVVEYILIDQFFDDGAVKAGGKVVTKKGASEIVEKGAVQGGKTVTQKMAAKQVTNATVKGATVPPEAVVSTSYVGYAITAAMIVFDITMLVLDILDKAGFNQIMGPADLEGYRDTFADVFEENGFDLNEKVELPVAVMLYDVYPDGSIGYSEWGELYIQYVNEYLMNEYGYPENWADSLREVEIEKPSNFDEIFRYFGGTPDAKQSYITWGVTFLVIILIILMFLIFKK